MNAVHRNTHICLVIDQINIRMSFNKTKPIMQRKQSVKTFLYYAINLLVFPQPSAVYGTSSWPHFQLFGHNAVMSVMLQLTAEGGERSTCQKLWFFARNTSVG